MEHAALLEGILDRIRYLCADTRGLEKNIIPRLHHATSYSMLRLIQIILTNNELENPAPLVWHDLLLHSIAPAEIQVNDLHRSLQQMCKVLEDLDTKSTNL